MESKYIEFELSENKPKTVVFDVVSKSDGDRLGQIKWYAHWRQYVYFPDSQTIYSKGCMADINSFIEHLMNNQKEIAKGVKIEYH